MRSSLAGAPTSPSLTPLLLDVFPVNDELAMVRCRLQLHTMAWDDEDYHRRVVGVVRGAADFVFVYFAGANTETKCERPCCTVRTSLTLTEVSIASFAQPPARPHASPYCIVQ